MRTISPLVSLGLILAASPLAAQDREVPYWASIRADTVNMRVGPSESYPIQWVYQRAALPVKVLRVQEGWRLVEDPDGATGWMVARFLSLEPTGIVKGDGKALMRDGPSSAGRMLWKVEPGVVGKLGKCEDGWCRFDVEGHKGWIERSRIWGGADR